MWVAHRQNKRDDQGWETPKNLGCTVNSAWNDIGPNLLEEDTGGQSVLYFSSNRPGGSGGSDIYSSPMYDKDSFGPPSLVPGLNTSANDQQPTLSKNGLEIIFTSNRAGGFGGADLWVSTRATLYAPWSVPVNLGPLVNSSATDFRPSLSSDGTTLYFASERLGSSGPADIYFCTRTKLHD